MFSRHLLDNLHGIRACIPPVDLRVSAVFKDNLRFAAAIMVASEKLLETAAAAIPSESTPFLQSLKAYYVRHLEEERGHFEWLMDDIGGDFKCDWMAAEITGAQYYAIHHWSPVALLGYMLVLEGFPAPMETIVALEEIYGKRYLRCMRYHAEHDLEHRVELYQILDNTPEKYQQLIEQNAVHTQTLIGVAQKTWGV